MPSLETLQLLGDLFWRVYLITLALVFLRVLWSRWWDLGRCGLALVLASAAQWAIERELGPGGYLLPGHHLLIDLAVFVMIVTPPLRYWQAVLGALVLAQLVTHALWLAAPALGQWHWLGGVLIGFVKCGVLLLWAGGPQLERIAVLGAGRLRRAAARLVPALSAGELAQ